MPLNMSITQHLEQARKALASIEQHIGRLQHERAVAAAKVEAFELAAGTSQQIEMPTRRTLDVPDRAKTKRAPAGSWKMVFRHIAATGKPQFNYNDVISTANELGIVAEKTSARVRVSKFKDGGYLERVDEGIYKVTPKGEQYFAGE